jgi:hypothetical protein
MIGGVTQQSALFRTETDELRHVIAKIDVLSPSDAGITPEIRDYGSLDVCPGEIDKRGVIGAAAWSQQLGASSQ